MACIVGLADQRALTAATNFLTGRFADAYGCSTLGIRSEHIGIAEDKPVWKGKVAHSEALGSDTYVFVEIGSDEPLIVRCPGNQPMPLGHNLGLVPQPDQVHRFDAVGRPIRSTG